jgi:hypothetical protein
MKIKKILKGRTWHVGSYDLKIKCHKALWLQIQCHRFMTWTYKCHITWFKAHGFWHACFYHAGVINVDMWQKFHILWLKSIVQNRHISCSVWGWTGLFPFHFLLSCGAGECGDGQAPRCIQTAPASGCPGASSVEEANNISLYMSTHVHSCMGHAQIASWRPIIEISGR